jgi:hypothetical protein
MREADVHGGPVVAFGRSMDHGTGDADNGNVHSEWQQRYRQLLPLPRASP